MVKHKAKIQKRSYNHYFTQKGGYFVCTGTPDGTGCGLALTGEQLRTLRSQRCPGPKAQTTEVCSSW